MSVITTIVGDQVKVSWNLITDNGTPVTEYKVFIQEIGTTTYTPENTDCVGSDATVIANNECLINLSSLTISPFNVDGGDSIFAKVSATNIYGESEQSVEGNGAYYTRVPDSPISLTEDLVGKTSTTINLVWSDGANSGGVPIIDYRVNLALGGESSIVASGITDQAYTITGLTLGVTYELTVEARNSIGYSSPSQILTVHHALVPLKPATPFT